MKTFEIKTTTEVTEQGLDNIVDAAINACSYWCDLLEYGKEPTSKVTAMSEALSHGGTLKFHLDESYEEGGETVFELTTEKLVDALTDNKDFDFEDYDGPMADAVLQKALFGEVIYG